MQPYATLRWGIISLYQRGGEVIEAELFRGGGVSITTAAKSLGVSVVKR